MGCNIPRPTRRPPTPSFDGPVGNTTNAALTANEQRRLMGIDPVPDVQPVAMVPGPDQRFNCPNCCAAITGPFCEYCGTVFDQKYQKQDQHDHDVVIPIYIGQQHVDDVIQAFNHFHDVAHRIGGS